MDAIIEFLNDTLGDNYIYIIGIGAIVLFILVGFLASGKGSKRKAKNQEENMANINEVSTGEITQVSDTLQEGRMNPVDVAGGHTADALVVDKEPVIPVNNEISTDNNFNIPVANESVTEEAPAMLKLSEEPVLGGTTPVESPLPQPAMESVTEEAPAMLKLSEEPATESPTAVNIDSEMPMVPTKPVDTLENNNLGPANEVPKQPEPLRFENIEAPTPIADTLIPPSPLNNNQIENAPEVLDIVEPVEPKIDNIEPVNVDYTAYIPDESQRIDGESQSNILNGEETPVDTNDKENL